MPKIRVSALAKELGVTSKVLLERLNGMGENVRSASSTVEESVVRRYTQKFPTSGARPLLPEAAIDEENLALETSHPARFPMHLHRGADVEPDPGDRGHRRVELLASLLRVTGLTDDPARVLLELDRANPTDDAAMRRWVEGDGAQWIRRASGSAELWLDVLEDPDEVTVGVLDVDMDRERVFLSVRATQEDPWEHFARTHAIGQVVPGKVTKLVPFGAFVRVDDGIDGLVHISELAERHVELPEQVVTVGTDIFVKVIDIDLERRRISLSLRQANEDGANQVEFDPTLYGMVAEYDEEGNYKYPEGFDPESNEWLEGFEKQRETWEKQYVEAHSRWEAHRAQVKAFAKADAEAGGGSNETSYSPETGSSSSDEGSATRPPAPVSEGTLASDEALAALRKKLQGEWRV